MPSLSRRDLLNALGSSIALLASTAVTGAASAEEAGRPFPSTLTRRYKLPAGRRRIAVGATPLTHLSINSASGAFRTRKNGQWSDWRDLATCSGGRDNVSTAALLPIAPGVVEYELDLLRQSTMCELDTLTGPSRAMLESSAPVVPVAQTSLKRAYFSRAAWGADESLRFTADGLERYPIAYFPVQTLTVHHTAISVGRDPAADVRAIYHDHVVNRDFGDIGYHLLVDPAGCVYEGRWSGEDRIPVFAPGPQAGGKPLMANAAHVGGYNAGNVGVCVMGDFSSALPSKAATDSLVVLLAALASVCELDPLGRTNYVNPISGSTATVDTISGHRDWLATECPGNRFYPDLASIRRRVSKLLPK